MARSDSPSDDESPTTEGAPTAAAFADTILERMAQQDAVQKATNEQLATIAAILAPLAGNSGDPASTVRKQLFDTYRTAGAENMINTNVAQVQTPGGVDLVTVRELAELKQSFLDMKDRMLEGPTSAPLIERVLAETLKTPFSRRITDVRYRPAEKIRLPTFAGKADPTDHITAFNIAMGQTNFSDEERDAGYCRLFVESLQGPALGWFTGLERDSINDFHDLTSVFLKQYIMFTRQGATLSDLWNLSQGANQSLRDFIEKFKAVASKVHIPDSIVVDALMNTLYFKSLFREDLYRNPTKSLQDAIARSNNFIRMEEDTTTILKKMNAAAKPTTAPKAPEARQEPRQYATGNKSNHQKSFVYVVEGRNPPPGSTVIVREKGWNVWENDEKP
ncbi:uncharacterized protein LOC125585878 [Brassica napus]|uniref:uncharacterized protein LOC125585878 n=1 Tax=Brassica napus TaxID=3708 RepID=UPI002079241E|nr:uncharacterized protein LOC125585878 [Brassica napus]